VLRGNSANKGVKEYRDDCLLSSLPWCVVVGCWRSSFRPARTTAVNGRTMTVLDGPTSGNPLSVREMGIIPERDGSVSRITEPSNP
jgi:hypothetical protein